MVTYDIVLNDIRLRIICEEKFVMEINKLMLGHAYIEEPKANPTYTLVIIEKEKNNLHGLKAKLIDKWFNNASCKVCINNNSKEIFLHNIEAKNNLDKNLLIQYFVCNVFNRLLEERGYYALHASSVELNGEGVAFVGARNSGKTNCMLTMMGAGFNSVTNDKLGIQYNDSKINGYGVAQDVSIRMDANFRNQPQNRKYIRFAEREGLNLSDENKMDGNSIHLESRELAELNGVKQVPLTRIKHIIFPKYDGKLKKVSVSKISPLTSKKIIISQKLPMVHDTKIFLKNIHTIDIPIYSEEKTIDIISDLDNYEIMQGENSSESFVEEIERILKK